MDLSVARLSVSVLILSSGCASVCGAMDAQELHTPGKPIDVVICKANAEPGVTARYIACPSTHLTGRGRCCWHSTRGRWEMCR